MSARSTSHGRALPFLLLGVLVALAVVVLFVADPFGSSGPEIGRYDDSFEPGELPGGDGGATGHGGRAEEGAALVGLYGEGDLGAVRVRLLRVEDRAPFAEQPLRLVSRRGDGRERVSGADGVAVFDRVPPARGYRLEIGGEGHAPVTIQGVHVEPGALTDLGDIVLGEHVVLRGRVVTGTGRALPGTAVAVYTPNRGMLTEGFLFNMVKQATNFPAPVEAVLTDEGGWFTLTALEDGVYRLEARLGGFATRYESDVVVARDRPAKDMTIVLGEGATLTGHVRDENGKAVEGAQVVAVRDSGRRFFGSGTLERDVAVTDGDGRYVIDTLTLGTSYRFGVLAEGYAPTFDMNSEEIQERRVEKDFDLVRGGGVTGRVLQKDDGQPVAGANVLVAVGRMGFGRRGGSQEDTRTATGQARTDAEGRFTIENLLPGPVMSAQVKASGYVPFTASQWTGNSWGDIVPGEVLEVSAELERGGVIEGTVYDDMSREPIPGAEVTVIPRDAFWRVFASGSPHGETDFEGRYALTGVAPGRYGVVAVAPGYAASDPGVPQTEVTLPETGGVVTRDVALGRAGSVTGVVTDSVGEPVAGARVRSRVAPTPRGEGGERGGRRGGMNRLRSFLPGASGVDLTDQEGRFYIEDVSSEGRWILSVEADDYVTTESEPFNVRPGEEKEVDVVLVGGGNVEGRVVDEQGRFVAGARVQAGHLPADRAGRGRLSAWEVDRYLDPTVHITDESGRFRATDLPPGTAVVKVEREGYVTFYKRNLVIRSDETVTNYTVSMAKGDVLEGTVRGADGRPLEGAWVAVTKNAPPPPGEEAAPAAEEASDEIEPRLSSRSDGDGRFRIENIPPGMYEVVVWFAPGHRGWGRDRSEQAIRRGISSSAKSVEFRLEASTGGPGGPGGR